MNENSLMTVPEHLDKFNEGMDMSVRQYLTVTDAMLKEKKIYDEISEDGTEQILELQMLRAGLAQNSSASLYAATASDQSGGKSTLTNGMLGYPLLPTAMNTTTACATEIHYGISPSLQIRYYAKPEGNAFEEGGPSFSGNHVLGNDIWQQLREFAILCIQEHIIYAETLQYHASRNLTEPDVTWEDLEMSPKDPKHVVQLLLILFTTYVGQNNPNPDEHTVKVCAKRENLIRILGVNPDRDYAVRVSWDHPALKQGLVIVDLPGLSANVPNLTAPDGTVRRSHERISVDYLQTVDAIFLLFDPTALAAGASKILETVLASERMKHIISRENRIIPILNKVDLPGAEQAIPYSTNQIRQILGSLKPPYVYPMSTLYSEYRFVENGITPIRNTQAYLRSHGRVRESFRDFLGVEPTQEQVENKVQSDLKKSYEKSYQFTDVDGVPCSINLGQWIQMMTTDYLSRTQSLKVIELLRMGMEANRSVIQMVKTRTFMLEMLKNGGEELTESLIDSLIGAVEGSIYEFNNRFDSVQKNLQNKMAKLASQEVPQITVSYAKALDAVESDLAALIRSEVSKMQPNFAGNYILNPEDAWTEDGKKCASNNASVLDGLLKKLENFHVRDRLRGSEQQLSDTVSEVQKSYKDSLPAIYTLYDGLTGDISVSMDNAYEQGKADSENPAHFETVYGALYQQLRDSLLEEIEQTVIIIKDMLRMDTRMADVQKATIDAAANISVDLEDKYRRNSDLYIRNMKTKTQIGTPAFDKQTLEATLQQPFFTEAARVQYAQKVSCTFSEDYAMNLPRVMQQIYVELRTMNTTGLQGKINGLTAYVRQKLGQGGQALDNEISNLNFYNDYIRKQMKELMDRISEPWEVLHGCDWAVNELDAIRTIYEGLCAVVG